MPVYLLYIAVYRRGKKHWLSPRAPVIRLPLELAVADKLPPTNDPLTKTLLTHTTLNSSDAENNAAKWRACRPRSCRHHSAALSLLDQQNRKSAWICKSLLPFYSIIHRRGWLLLCQIYCGRSCVANTTIDYMILWKFRSDCSFF